MNALKSFVSSIVAMVVAAGGNEPASATVAQLKGKLEPNPDRAPPARRVRYRNNLKAGYGWLLTAHRSHSSHSSHSSHYSGAGAGTAPVAPVPATPVTPDRAAAPPTRLYSPPVAVPATPTTPAANPEVTKLMMRIQLALNARGYCKCEIDGASSAALSEAIKKFQQDNKLAATGLPDTVTLERLGISF